jgi:hypothetical protein
LPILFSGVSSMHGGASYYVFGFIDECGDVGVTMWVPLRFPLQSVVPDDGMERAVRSYAPWFQPLLTPTYWSTL